jgi:hypothetical protein
MTTLRPKHPHARTRMRRHRVVVTIVFAVGMYVCVVTPMVRLVQ